MSTILGAQCFGLRKELSKDLVGTIKKIHEIGFDAIEPCVSLRQKQGRTPRYNWSMELLMQAKKEMDQLGLSMPSVHVGAVFGLFFLKTADKLVKGILEIHKMTGITNFVFSGMFSKSSQAKKWGNLLRKVAEGIKPYGCCVLYHNHDDEFQTIVVDGEKMTALDYFYRIAGSDVMLQLDIGWAMFADDEIKVAQKYAGRIKEIHCKDFYKEVAGGAYNKFSIPKTLFSPIGEGAVKTKEIMQMRADFKNFNGVIIIDQDHSGGEILSDLVVGYCNLKELLD